MTSELSAGEALELLEAGNRRFVRGEGRRHDPYETRREALLEGQSPTAVVLTCSDSRVAPEIVFDSGLGELFVVRVAGNVADETTVASVEYAVLRLGVALVVVMGHQDCGAVAATLAGAEVSASLSRLQGRIEEALEGLATDERGPDVVARRNAGLQAARLIEGSVGLRRARDEGGIVVVAGFLRLTDGAVELEPI